MAAIIRSWGGSEAGIALKPHSAGFGGTPPFENRKGWGSRGLGYAKGGPAGLAGLIKDSRPSGPKRQQRGQRFPIQLLIGSEFHLEKFIVMCM